ncbi:MAG: hypothetical protein O2964_16300 [Verrucomicrobia bacterium]|nr:hypothetical protein [Verrucomicrobiota bacterium]
MSISVDALGGVGHDTSLEYLQGKVNGSLMSNIFALPNALAVGVRLCMAMGCGLTFGNEVCLLVVWTVSKAVPNHGQSRAGNCVGDGIDFSVSRRVRPLGVITNYLCRCDHD